MMLKKKILICDPLSYSGHFNYNYGIIRATKQHYDVGIVVNKQTFDKLLKTGIDKDSFDFVFPTEWGIVPLSKRMNKVFYHLVSRFYVLMVLLKTLKLSKNYDAVIFTCTDIFTFCIVSWFFNKRCFVVDHGIGNVKSKKLYRLAWNITNKNVNMIVLEPFIKEMVEENIKKRNVFVIRHPLPKIYYKQPKKDTKGILLFSPSGSNDESFIKELCQYDICSNIRVVVKSHQINYKSDRVVVYNSYITNEEYQNYLSDCDYMLLAYESSYNYRISAVLFESLILGKPVLLYSNNTLSIYKEIFPNSVFLFKSVKEMLDIITEGYVPKTEENLKLYQDEVISNVIMEMIESTCSIAKY